MVRSIPELKSFLETGDKPSQSQWHDILDTMKQIQDLAEAGGGPGAGGGFIHEHHQTTAQMVWTVNHGLEEFPLVEISDDNRNVVDAPYFHLDDETLIVSNNASYTGYVRCFVP